MANIDLAPGALAKPEPHRRTRARADRLQAQNDRAVYAWVSERDGLTCRACGTYAGVEAERHHLKGRQITTVEDVCILCPKCHRETHVKVGGKTRRIYGNAELRSVTGKPCGLTVEMRLPKHGWVKWCDR